MTQASDDVEYNAVCPDCGKLFESTQGMAGRDQWLCPPFGCDRCRAVYNDSWRPRLGQVKEMPKGALLAQQTREQAEREERQRLEQHNAELQLRGDD